MLYIAPKNTTIYQTCLEFFCAFSRLFDDFIDHSYYDNEFPVRNRITKMYQILDPVMKRDILEEAVVKYADRLENNAKYFQSDTFTDLINNSIIKKLFN